MEEVKTLLASKTVLAAIVAIFAGGLSVFGYTLDTKLQYDIVELTGLAVTQLGGVGAVLGGFGAIYGRIKATKKIK